MAILETDYQRTIPSIPNYPKSLSAAEDKKDLSFDDQFKCAEDRVREKFIAALEALPEASMAEWLARLLEAKIVPALERIGFDPQLSWALFKMAAPAWEFIGPIGPKTIFFHPVLMRELADIRLGYLNTAKQNSEKRLLLATMNSHDRFQLVGDSMDPGNLFHLLGDIATSWIILPRAFGHLDKSHARWLPGYLECLEKESNSDFAKILMRIIIEFVGNFALKFSHRVDPKKRIDDALFYGFAAMFWKNLRSPPQASEDRRLFENFLRWTQMFCKRCASISADKSGALAIMERATTKVFAVEPLAFCK
jgi:hypothetical protein